MVGAGGCHFIGRPGSLQPFDAERPPFFCLNLVRGNALPAADDADEKSGLTGKTLLCGPPIPSRLKLPDHRFEQCNSIRPLPRKFDKVCEADDGAGQHIPALVVHRPVLRLKEIALPSPHQVKRLCALDLQRFQQPFAQVKQSQEVDGVTAGRNAVSRQAVSRILLDQWME